MKIKSCNDLLNLINFLRESDEYVSEIFLNGSCYKFYLFLKNFIPENCCTPMINKEKNHIVTKYKNRFFDISGEVFGDFFNLTKEDLSIVERWSFRKQMMLKIKECPFCEEKIVV